MLGRIVCLYLDFRKMGATAAVAAASLLPSSGFWPASSNVSHYLNDLKKKIKINNEDEKIMTMKVKGEKQDSLCVGSVILFRSCPL